MKKLAKIYYIFLYLAPAILFFSYYPIISLGQTESMNLELSLPLIWLALFDILSLIILFSPTKDIRKHLIGISDRKFFLFSIFPLYATISIFWSPNTSRAILTTDILWLLFFAIFSIIFIQKNLPEPKKLSENIIKSIFISTSIVCIWCFIQCIMDVAGCDRAQTLLCQGCTSLSFSFPHPNGFAIEPQFMGNLLLAPTILACYIFINSPARRKTVMPFLILFTTTLFITFSRGAIYSFLLAIFIMVLISIIKQKTAKPLYVFLTTLISFIIALNIQGLMAQFSYTNDTYQTGITKSLDQMTLGIFHLTSEKNSENSSQDQSENINLISEQTDSTFDGYVEESTNVRMSLTNVAIKALSEGGANIILFGTGLGGAGTYLYANNYLDSPKEIIQNQYASLLLETGMIGILILLFLLVMVIKIILHSKKSLLYIALGIAYACSLLFFAGLPNALQIYLMPPLISKTKSYDIIKK